MSEEKPCVFCDRRNLEERIIGETDHLYFVATLGQITDGGYTLIIPKKHSRCVAEMDWVETSLSYFSNRVCEAIRAEYKSPVTIFEHGVVGQTIQHAHLHFVPAELNLTKRVRTDFPNSEMDIVPTIYNLTIEYPKRFLPYLLWQDRDGMAKICWNPPAPAQYFRTIVAELLGRPERANWRNMDPELDKQLWSQTVTRLQRYLNFKLIK